MPSQNDQLTVRVSQSQAGVSMIEGIVALAVLIIVAMTTVSFFSQHQATLRTFGPGAECKIVLESQMNLLKSQGTTPWGLPWDHQTGQEPLLVAPIDYADAWLADNVRYTPLRTANHALVTAPTAAGGLPTVNNASLQRGTIGTLNTLYNNANPALCNNPDGIDISTLPARTGATLMPLFDQQALSGFKTNIRISAFRLSDGADLGCPGKPFWVRPQGIPDPSQGPTPPFIVPPSYTADAGYRVRLNGTYTDAQGSTRSCEVTEDFRYPVDQGTQSLAYVISAVMPAIRQDAVTPANAVPLVAGMVRPVCTHKPALPATLRLEIGFITNPANPQPPVEQGTVFLCRDVSQQRNPNYCPGAVDAEMQGENYNVDGTLANNPPWVPCSQVTACGVPPAQPGTFSNNKYTINYTSPAPGGARDGLWGCDVKIDVASVDLAGNFRKLSTIPHPTQTGIAGLNADASLYFFQPVDCYACFRRKKRSWGAFIATTILVGPIISCLAGVGGVCRPKGAKFIGNNCRDIGGGRTFCRLQPKNRPKWAPDTDRTCPQSGPIPFPPPMQNQTYTLTPLEEGVIHDELGTVDFTNGTYCEVAAICGPGQRWTGLPDENNREMPIATCGQIWTEYRINTAGLAAGSTVPRGTPHCYVAVPNPLPPETTTPLKMTYDDYSSYRICSPAQTGVAGNTICQINNSPVSSGPPIVWPSDARTGTANQSDPNRYFYYERTLPVPANLPACTPLPGDPPEDPY